MAVLIAVLTGAVLALIHRDDLFATASPPAAEDPFARCVTERSAEIDQMVADGVVDAARAAQFKTRAEALCRASGPAR